MNVCEALTFFHFYFYACKWLRTRPGQPLPDACDEDGTAYWWWDRSHPICKAADAGDAETINELGGKYILSLWEYYKRLVKVRGVHDENAEDFAGAVLFGRPSRKGGGLIGGYLQHPRWAPLKVRFEPTHLGEKLALRGILLDIIDPEREGVVRGDFVIRRLTETRGGDDTNAEVSAESEFPDERLGPEQVCDSEQKLQNMKEWESEIEKARERLSPSDQLRLDQWGPWDGFKAGSTSEGGENDAERRQKSRMRQRLFQQMGFNNSKDLAMHVLLNRLTPRQVDSTNKWMLRLEDPDGNARSKGELALKILKFAYECGQPFPHSKKR